MIISNYGNLKRFLIMAVLLYIFCIVNIGYCQEEQIVPDSTQAGYAYNDINSKIDSLRLELIEQKNVVSNKYIN